MSDDATLNIEFNEADREYLRTGYELLISDPEGHSTRFPVLTGEVTLGGARQPSIFGRAGFFLPTWSPLCRSW
ncbi:MAG: hypothetical protein WC314_20415 [Vulcanimicrobiota bacterium]